MALYYISGGAQRTNALELEEFQGYERGLLLAYDTASGEVTRLLEYESPAEVLPEPDPGTLFKAATLEDNRLYICTPTEVMVYRLPSLERVRYLSLPSFHDVHHVRPLPGGNVLVTVTGLDLVQEITPEGTVAREWDVLGEPLWSRFDPATDYRRVASTKPHKSHPNYTFLLGDDIWVTRFHQMDAVCLTRPGARIEIAAEKPHDGIVAGDLVWFTTVNGCLVAADTGTGQVARTLKLSQGIKLLGWCRGLCIGPDGTAVVGFSRLRPTRWRENVNWIQGGINALKDSLGTPAGIIGVDLASGATLWSKNLEPYGMGTVFSIHRID